MPCAGFSSELYDLYALGALEARDAAEIDEHLVSACETCQHAVQQSLARASLLAMAVPAAAPSRGLRRRVLSSVKPVRAGIWAIFREPRSAWAIAMFCLCLAIGLGWFVASRPAAVPAPVISTHVSPPPVVMPAPLPQPAAPAVPVPVNIPDVSTLKTEIAGQQNRIQELEGQVRAKETELASAQRDRNALQTVTASSASNPQLQELQRQLDSNRQRADELTHQVEFYRTALESQRNQSARDVQLIAVLSAPSLRVLDLRPTEQGRNASARALLTDRTPILFYASNLPSLPPGRTYQLWVMRNRGRAITSGGIFQPDASQTAALTVPNNSAIADITALAITEEPSGGVPLPTGHKILIGTVKS